MNWTAVLGEQGVTGELVANGGELEYYAKVVGEFAAAGVKPGGEVSLFESKNCLPSIARIAICPVGEIWAGLSLHIEGGDVVGLHFTQRRPGQVI